VYVWIQDAVKQYDRSRPWLQSQIENGTLTYAKFAGDQRIYLLRAELDDLLGKPVEQGRKQPLEKQDQAG
jgi:hypothetical protein